jgi:hypothetical protein
MEGQFGRHAAIPAVAKPDARRGADAAGGRTTKYGDESTSAGEKAAANAENVARGLRPVICFTF